MFEGVAQVAEIPEASPHSVHHKALPSRWCPRNFDDWTTCSCLFAYNFTYFLYLMTSFFKYAFMPIFHDYRHASKIFKQPVKIAHYTV